MQNYEVATLSKILATSFPSDRDLLCVGALQSSGFQGRSVERLPLIVSAL